MSSYKAAVPHIPQSSTYATSKDGKERLRATALITKATLGSINFKAAQAYETYEKIRAANKGKAGDGKTKYMFLMPLFAEYNDGYCTNKFFIEGIVMDFKYNVAKKQGTYGQTFLSIGIPEHIYSKIRDQIVEVTGIAFNENAMKKANGYVWENVSVDKFSHSLFGVSNDGVYALDYASTKMRVRDNPLCYGVVEMKMKATDQKNDDPDDAVENNKWHLGWVLQSVYMYGATKISGPSLTGGSNQVEASVPKLATPNPYIEMLIDKCCINDDDEQDADEQEGVNKAKQTGAISLKTPAQASRNATDRKSVV